MRPLFLDPTARYDSLICSQYLDGNWSRHCQTAIWFWVGKQKCIIILRYILYESRIFPWVFVTEKGNINRKTQKVKHEDDVERKRRWKVINRLLAKGWTLQNP